MAWSWRSWWGEQGNRVQGVPKGETMGGDNTSGPRARRRGLDSYFEELVAEYRIICLQLPPEIRAGNEYVRKVDGIIEQAERYPSSLTSSDYVFLEKAILMLQPEDALRRRAWQLRERYQALVGAQAYATYLDSDPPRANDAPIDRLRSDLLQLLDHIHRSYATTSFRERVQNRIVYNITLGLLVASAVVALCLGIDLYNLPGPEPRPKGTEQGTEEEGEQRADEKTKDKTKETRTFISLIPAILLVGAIGAFLSLLNRFRRLHPVGDPIRNSLALRAGEMTIYLSPITGALFGLLMYLLLVSGLFHANFTPALAQVPSPVQAANGDPQPKPSQSPEPIRNPSWAVPASAGDLARLLLLCFLAGFAERLIPDAIDRLILRQVVHLEGPPPEGPRASDGGRQRRAGSDGGGVV